MLKTRGHTRGQGSAIKRNSLIFLARSIERDGVGEQGSGGRGGHPWIVPGQLEEANGRIRSMPSTQKPGGAKDRESTVVKAAPFQEASPLWPVARWAFRAGLIVLFFLVTRAGANYTLYGQFHAMTLADLVPVVQATCVPTVRAMKEYARDHGQWPAKIEDLVPAYLANRPLRGECAGDTYMYFGAHGMMIECRLRTNGDEWRVHGPGLSGEIPMDPIEVGPGTRAGS